MYRLLLPIHDNVVVFQKVQNMVGTCLVGLLQNKHINYNVFWEVILHDASFLFEINCFFFLFIIVAVENTHLVVNYSKVIVKHNFSLKQQILIKKCCNIIKSSG